MKRFLVVLVLTTLGTFGASAATIPFEWIDNPPGTCEQVHRSSYARTWARATRSIARGARHDAVAAPLLVFDGRYAVTVNYDLSLDEMIAAGELDDVAPGINAANFPVSARGTAVIEVTLLRLNRCVSTDAILAFMDRNGYRPATLPELLALRIAFRDLRYVTALGSVWYERIGNDRIFHNVVSIYGRYGQRRLGLEYERGGWGVGVSRFAAVRKTKMKMVRIE